jgi:hypothetical protein
MEVRAVFKVRTTPLSAFSAKTRHWIDWLGERSLGGKAKHCEIGGKASCICSSYTPSTHLVCKTVVYISVPRARVIATDCENRLASLSLDNSGQKVRALTHCLSPLSTTLGGHELERATYYGRFRSE